MMTLMIWVLLGLFVTGLTLSLASPLGGLQLALALLGVGTSMFGAVAAGVGGAVGGLALAALAVMVALALAAGAVVLAVLLVPVAIALAAGALLFGLAPLLLPVALIVGLIWAIMRASRSGAAPPPAAAIALPAR